MEIKVGDLVVKKSGKPFKSRIKVNTVRSHTINPNTNLPALAFYEDDSVVDEHRCRVVDDQEASDILLPLAAEYLKCMKLSKE